MIVYGFKYIMWGIQAVARFALFLDFVQLWAWRKNNPEFWSFSNQCNPLVSLPQDCRPVSTPVLWIMRPVIFLFALLAFLKYIIILTFRQRFSFKRDLFGFNVICKVFINNTVLLVLVFLTIMYFLF